MKRLAFPTLFTLLLLGLWIFTKSHGGADTSPPQTATPPSKPEVLSEREKMFAGTLSPKNQETFTQKMNKKQRTMAMEMVVENNRSGGSLTSDQAVEQLSQDFNLNAPQPKAPPQTPSVQPAPAPPSTTPATPSTPPSSTNPSMPQTTPNQAPQAPATGK